MAIDHLWDDYEYTDISKKVYADEQYGNMVGMPDTKLADVQMWIRIGANGVPQVIRVEPMVTDDGVLIPQNVVLTVDEAPPQIMDRWAAQQMLSTPNCEPLARMLNWKHRICH